MKDVPPQSGTYKFWEPWRKKEEAGAIPAFRFPGKNVGGVLEKLPDPGTAFGLDFHCGFYASVTLKELAKVKNLQSLCIGGVPGDAYADLKDLAGLTNLRGLYLFYLPVTDAQLKHLAGLKNLQALDLSNTQVTDAGLTELAGLKSLQALNLGDTKVTAAGVTALQKELPRCKIMTNAAQTDEKGAEEKARAEQLSKELDEIVMKAEKKAAPQLPEKVTSTEQALKYAAAEYADQYRVLEHKGWWVVAWYGRDGSKPVLRLPGFAIRKNSKDYYGFGGW